MNKKIVKLDFFIFILLFSISWALYGGNTWNGDRDAYEAYYLRGSISPWGVEILYGYLNIYFHELGFSFQSFQIIISFVTIFITSIYLKKVSAYLGVSFLIYFVLMFPLDYVLMRTSLAYAVVMNAFVALSYGKRGCYVLLILIATMLHQSSLIFLIFLLANDGTKLKITYNYIFYSLLLIIILPLLFKFNFFPRNVVEHLAYYQTTWKTSFGNVACHLLSIFLIIMNFNCKGENSKYDCFIRNINIVSLLLFCLYFHSDIFVRVFRLLVFINIIYLIQIMMVQKKATIYSLFYVSFYAIYLFYYYIYLTLDNSLYPLIQSSIFSNW